MIMRGSETVSGETAIHGNENIMNGNRLQPTAYGLTVEGRVHWLALYVCASLMMWPLAAKAATEDLGNGFFHHGVATPISNHRGTVVTVDGEGRNIVLVWLYDHRGGYALLQIDAETGRSSELAMPFPSGGDGPFAAILSRANRYYTHFNGHFVEFDPATGKFTFFHKTAPRVAMSMTEDDRGVIWSATYPHSGLVSYDPKTGEFQDYGYLHQANWLQYPRSLAADQHGWIYIGIGNTVSHILAFQPSTREASEPVPPNSTAKGCFHLYRDVDGHVYGHHPGEKRWYRFSEGKAIAMEGSPPMRRKPEISGSQSLFHRRFPDGKQLKACDLAERVLEVADPADGTVTRVSFDYTSEGAHVMGLAAAPDRSICGGTAFPMRFFQFLPDEDRWVNRPAYGQWNTVAVYGDRFFVGGYGGGFLLEWDPRRPWKNTVKGNSACNPRFLTQCAPTINRPHDLLVSRNGRTVVLAGTPGYGYTGGGLLFWDRESETPVVLEHDQLLPEQSTMALAATTSGQIVGGTTTAAGTGGEKKADQAELYLLDSASKKITWHQVLFPGVQSYTDLCAAPRGLIYGIADRQRFFVFDPGAKKLIHEKTLDPSLGTTVSHQGPRILLPTADGTVYLLLRAGIARIDPESFAVTLVARSPVPISAGGDLLDGRIYFAGGSHVYSYRLAR